MTKRTAFVFFLLVSIAFAEDVSMERLLSETGAVLEWDSLGSHGALVLGSKRILFAEGSPWLLVSGHTARAVTAPKRSSDGSLVFSPSFLSLAKESLAPSPEADRQSKFSIAAIIIDAGHGGKDPGSVATHIINGKKTSLAEKDITLSVSKSLERMVKSRYPGKKVIMTRDSDTYPSLEDRVELANGLELGKKDAVIFISIHANASFNKKASGYEVWYLSPDYRRQVLDGGPDADTSILPILNGMLEEEYTTESIIIAKNILEGLNAKLGNGTENRGIKAEEWFVVRNAKMPSVLVELGFITNPEEAVKLSDPAYLQRTAEGIYNGLVNFIGYFEETKGFAE